MKKINIIQKRDWILFCSIFFICGILFCMTLFFKKEGNRILVEQNGHIVLEVSLNENGTYVIEENDYRNELVIENGKAFMKSSNCKDLVCVHQGSISKVNETITCLPHKLIVYVAGGDVSDVDAVVN